jgi:hypothetical protein
MSDPSDPSIDERVEESIRARGPDYEHLVEHRREVERVRKRDARKRQTSEQREHERERKREARKRQTPEQREHEKKREGSRNRVKLKPFLAIDGEGGGTDELGRQNYFLMVASGQTSGEEYVLHRQGKPLSTRDCLEFILSLPADRKLVAYGVGYDGTQILRGIKPPTLRQILNPRQGKKRPLLHILGRLRDHLPTRAIFSSRVCGGRPSVPLRRQVLNRCRLRPGVRQRAMSLPASAIPPLAALAACGRLTGDGIARLAFATDRVGWLRPSRPGPRSA